MNLLILSQNHVALVMKESILLVMVIEQDCLLLQVQVMQTK